MNSAAGTGGRALLAAGTKTYHYGDLADLDGVPGALRCVVETLTSLGYRPATPSGADVPSYLLDPGLQELKDAVREAAASAPVVVVYYTGHGMKPQRDPYLLVTAQATSGQLEDNALEARQFVRLVLRRDANDQELPADEQPQVLVILDCCFSGVGGAEALKESLQDIGSPKVWVLASASLVEYAEQGRFAEALQQVLHDPEAGSLEPLLDLNWVAEKINKVLRQAGQEAGWFPPGGRSTGFTPFFPNPDYVPGGVAGLTVAEQQYWVSRLRGAPAESAAVGFYITGRTGRRRVVEDLAAWMRDPGRVGLAVVTGGPGCGKSAMLALPVLLTDRERRDALIAEADHDSLAAQAADLFDGLPVFGIHAGGLNLYEVVKAIAKHFGRSADSPEDLLADLEDRPEASPLILVIDGVDEAREPPKLLTDLLQPLARRAAVRIVIGARHVLAGVADAGLTIDLDTEEYRDPQALADYAHQLLIAAREPDVATPYRGRHDDTAVTVAAGIAEKATKPTTTAGQAEGQEESFLLAQLLARAVRGRPQVLDITHDDWAKQLPAGIGAAFDEDLRYLLDKWEPNATVEPIAKALLTALAWAKGPGLPRRWIWGPVAQALAARTGTGTLDLDRYGVRWLLDNAGAYIIEDLGPGQQSVFRPFHDLIAANLRGQPSDEQAAADPTAAEAWEQRRQQTEKDVTRALLGTIPTASGGNPDWEQAHPYLRTYLAQHAAAGGPETLSALVHDADFLAAADPVTLSPLLSFTVPELRDIARIYRRALPQLGTDPQANAAYLQEAARALAGTAAERTGVRHLARPQSASARQDADQQHWLPRARGDPQANAAYLQEAARALAGTAAERTGVRHLARPQSAPARQDADQQHWLPRARGGPQESTAGFYITGKTGRLRAAMDLAAWMRDSDRGGLAVVTGSPGCGKSALLALPVLLTNRERRETLLAAADQDSLIARAADLFGGLPVIGVHARGMNPSQLAGAIASYLGRSADSPGDLLEDLDERPENSPPIVVIDAVDEARDPRSLLTGLLLPLARRPGLRVVVGVRRHVLSGIGYADLIIDLDSDAYQDPEALTEYVHNLLIASGEPGVTTPYQSDHAAAAVAVTIAQRARGSFLVGRLLALAARGGAEPADIARDDLPTSVAEAFDNDLARLGSKEPIARALLAALAWARGPGLPWEDIWVRVAQALVRLDFGDEQSSITGDDVRWLLDTARSYIVEEVGKGQRSVFRLFHDLLAAHLRGDPIIRQQGYGPAAIEAWSQRCARTERAVTDALLSTVPATSDGKADWELAHPYLRTYLAEHAAAAGPKVLSDLVHDADFLAAADPVTLNPLLSFTVPELSDIARTYWRARPQLGTDLRANAAYLQEAAHALVGAAGEQTSIRPLYRTQLASVRQDNSVLTFTGRAGAVFSVALGASPDGRLLLVSGCEDGTVRLWDPAIGAAAGAPLTGHEGWVFSVAFSASPDGPALLASGGEDGTVRLWDPTTGAAVGAPLTGHTGPVQAVALGASPDGRALLASGGEDGTVRLWDPTTGAAVGAPLTGHTGPVQAVALGASPDGRALLASGSWDGTVRLWDPTTGAAVGAPLTGHTGPVQAVALGASPDGRALLASGGWDGTVRLWDPTTGAAVGAPLTGHAGWVFSVAFGASPDGRALLASGGGDGTVRLWDPTTGAAVGAPLTGHTGPVEAVALGASPDGRPLLASGGGDNTVRLWDPATDAAGGAPLTGHTGPVQAVAIGASPDGRVLLASGSWDNTVRLWDPVTGTAVGTPLTGHTGPVQTVAFGASPDGRLLLASGSWDNTVRLWDLATGAAVGALLTGHTGSVQAVAFGASPGGRVLLASGGGDGTVRLWDLATGHPAGAPPLTGHAGQVFSVAFSANPDSQLLLASGSEDGTVRLWDPATGATVGTPLTGHTGPVQTVAFGASPGGRLLLASGSWDNTVRLWDPATGAAVGTPLTDHTGPVQTVAFGASPDGRLLLASGSWDNTVRLWDLAAAACIATFRRRCSVNSIAAVGLMLAIGDDEGICAIELEG